MHCVQLIQVADSERIEALLRFLIDQAPKVLISVLSLLNLSLQYFLQLHDFVEGFGIALLVPLALLLRLLLYLLLNDDVVVLEAPQSGLQLHGALLRS